MWYSAVGCIVALTLSLLAVPLAAGAQPAGKVWRIGVLLGGARETPRYAPFHQELRELGYVEGQNLVLEWRSSGGQADRFPALAAELVRLPVDIIVAGDNPAIAAAQRATSTIPIVMVLAASITASATFGHSASPDNVTCWHIVALQ